MQEQAIFIEALEMEDPAERAAFLCRACAGDTALRARIERLLQRHETAGQFLESPAAAPITSVNDSIRERPGTVIGPYRLMEQIGEGGMGLVFVAEQLQPVRRKVALKVIKPGMDTRQVVARFEAERQALALMDHLNIAKVLDGGETASGRPYFVMELVKGVPITEYCDHNKLPIRERLELFLNVCHAVQHAHQKGIIHRDIKPSNVLIMSQDGTPLVKVIDFGVVKAIGQELTDKTIYTQFTQLIGTPLYMSPEQAGQSSVDVDTRSDIYSLGVLLYELLTGKTPFDDVRFKTVGFDEMRRIIREEEPPRPSTRISTMGQAAITVSTQRRSDPQRLRRQFRGELDWIVMKALEKDRNRRYETASALAADVQRYLANEPVLACPPSAWYRLRKFARRNRTVLAVAGLTVLFIAVLGGGGGWLLRDRAAREQEVASERLQRERALDREVDLALEEARRLREQGQWPDALAAIQRTDKLLASAGRGDRPAPLLELHKELHFAQRLEDIYHGAPRLRDMPAGDALEPALGPRHSAEEDFFWGREQDSRFAEEFRNFGIDIDALTAAEAAARIGRTGIRPALVQALDEWAAQRKRARSNDDSSWKKLVEVARQADGDDWRNRFREALLARNRKALEKLADTLPIAEFPPGTVLLLGHVLLDLGLVEKAGSVLREGLARHPENFLLNVALGYLNKAQLKSPRYDLALGYYRAALAIRPANAQAHQAMADTLFEKGAIDDAMAEYSRMIDLAPNDPASWIARGERYDSLGKFEKAVTDLSKAIETNPQSVKAWESRGVAYVHHRDFDKGFADLNKALKLDPNAPYVWRERGRVYRDQGEHQKAIADFTRAIELNPTSFVSWEDRGTAYYLLRKYHEALADLNKAVELNPGRWLIYWDRGGTLMRLHQFEKARADFSRVIELDPDVPEARRARAATYLNLGQWDQAAADIARWLETRPGDHWPWRLSAAMHLYRGDVAGYRRACWEMLIRFGNTDQADIADCVVRACALAPNAVSELQSVVRLSELAVDKHGSDRCKLMARGLVAYRACRAADALTWLSRIPPKTDGIDPDWDATGFAIIALAENRLGRHEQAHAALASAQAIVAKKFPVPAKGRYFGEGWADWLHAYLLCREAEQELESHGK
jgi:serine/threonine protein kinase/regulator of sirC expression with transglutaminase-like and TPR domain